MGVNQYDSLSSVLPPKKAQAYLRQDYELGAAYPNLMPPTSLPHTKHAMKGASENYWVPRFKSAEFQVPDPWTSACQTCHRCQLRHGHPSKVRCSTGVKASRFPSSPSLIRVPFFLLLAFDREPKTSAKVPTGEPKAFFDFGSERYSI